jgi:drug/metabolite transporter (DMT)-like permease
VLLPFVIARGELGSLLPRWRFLFVLGAIQVAGPFIAINLGEQHISSSLTGILVASMPLFTVLMALRLDRSESVEGRGIVGVAAGLLGVAMIVGVDLSGDRLALVGGLLVLLGSAGYALGGLVLKRDGGRLDPLAVAFGALVTSAVMAVPVTLLELPLPTPGARAALATVALGILGTGCSFAIFYTLIDQVGPARASLVTYIVPVFALGYGVWLLHETASPTTLGGLVLVIAGSWLAASGTRSQPALQAPLDR